MNNDLLMMSHDGHKFVSSDTKINSDDIDMGFIITAINGSIKPILRKSLYGQYVKEFYAEGKYSRIK